MDLSLKVTEVHKKALATQGPKVQCDWKDRKPSNCLNRKAAVTNKVGREVE